MSKKVSCVEGRQVSRGLAGVFMGRKMCRVSGRQPSSVSPPIEPQQPASHLSSPENNPTESKEKSQNINNNVS